jgi:hypothetical protein
MTLTAEAIILNLDLLDELLERDARPTLRDIALLMGNDDPGELETCACGAKRYWHKTLRAVADKRWGKIVWMKTPEEEWKAAHGGHS